MQSRITNPAISVPGALEALQALNKAATEVAAKEGVPHSTIDLVHMRASQINGCAVCLDMHSRSARGHGVSDEKLHTLAGWRDTPYFDESERAALALTEAGTRLADRAEPVPDDVYGAAAKHFSDAALGALVVQIAAINAWNRLNVISGQVTGEWVTHWVA